MSWWDQPKSKPFDWFFKSFTIVNFTLLLISKEFIAKPDIATNKQAQCQFFGCITPIYFIHTLAGTIILFKDYDLSKTYPGYLAYIVFISLSYMMLILLLIMIFTIGVPNYIEHRRRRPVVDDNQAMQNAAEDLLANLRDEDVVPN